MNSKTTLFAHGGVLALAAVFPATALAQALDLVVLNRLNGGTQSVGAAVSGDGSVVVGFAADGAAGNAFRAFRWTRANGIASLGVLNGGTFSFATAANGDGTVVVGESADGAAGNARRAFRWTQAGGMVSLGVLNGGDRSAANGVNSEGSIVVGGAGDGAAAGGFRAFRWTQAGGMVSLGVLNGGIVSNAFGVSSDGAVVVGVASDGAAGNFDRAFRWTQATGMESLGTLNGGSFSFAGAVSGNGAVVVGQSADGAAGNARRAFRWTQPTGMVSLGVLNGGNLSFASAANSNGSVVVGTATDGAAGNVSRAFRWTQATGMQKVEDWLRASGVDVPADITRDAAGVSSDGSVVVGTLGSGSAFIARGASGLVALEDLGASLAGNSAAPAQAATLGGMVLNGAHSRPLAHRVEPGKSCFWIAGDVGRDDHGERDGVVELAQVAGCHRLASGLQGSLSIGRARSKQDRAVDGASDVRTTYGVAELLGNVPGTRLWPSAALFYGEGEVDARRGYPNAGAADFSSGQAAVQTAALRLRLDWESAARTGGTTFTPYADLSYSRTRIDGYTETGGGFPARFDASTDEATEARLGVDAAYPLSSRATLIGRLEAAHRFESTGASTSGTVLGLMDFSFPGQSHERDWLRAGAGVDAKVGPGTASAMLNITTEGAVPSYWLTLFYQIAF
jgi:probable HAF family extracellular repeat protein